MKNLQITDYQEEKNKKVQNIIFSWPKLGRYFDLEIKRKKG